MEIEEVNGKEEKKPWQSKTLWASVILAILPLFPSVSKIVSANPEIITMGLGVLFGLLRLVTKDEINIS